MTQIIPPRNPNQEDEEKRFYVTAKRSVKLQLEQEAFDRGTDVWTLGGLVIEAWLKAGCPDFGFLANLPCLKIRPRHRRHRSSRTIREARNDRRKAAQHA